MLTELMFQFYNIIINFSHCKIFPWVRGDLHEWTQCSILYFSSFFPTYNFQRITLINEHLCSNLKLPTPIPNVQPQTSNLQTYNLQPPASTSNFQPKTSNLPTPIPDLQLSTPNVHLPSFNLQPATSELQVPPFKVHPETLSINLYPSTSTTSLVLLESSLQ